MYLGIYILIGLIYCFINGFFRKLDTDGDWDMGLLWIFLWPLCILAWVLTKISKFKFRKRVV